jgi:DNA primase
MQNCTGATIHPALRKWININQTNNWIPEGIMTPVFDLNNEIVGCHNRFLSTVPQIKFASSIPNFHLFTNLRKDNKFDRIIIVEGVFDALAIDSVTNDKIGWIAPSTGFWTEEQLINLIYTLQHFPDTEVISAFDCDRVGLKSNVLLTYTLNRIGINTKIMNFIEGKDPAEAIHKHKLSIYDLKEKTLDEAVEEYLLSPHEPFKKFEDYMDNRHSSYSTQNYRWK